MNYGLPYQGSKNSIAEALLAALPPAINFVDLFFGGGALTHCAMLSGKYKHFVINDISKHGMNLFCDAIDGKYANENRWISREDFYKLRHDDSFVRICWSFGNKQRDYLYAREIEDYKRCFHLAVVNGDYAPMLERYGLDFSELDVMGGDLKQRRINTKRIMERYFKEGVLEKKGSHYILKNPGGGGYSTFLEHQTRTERVQGLRGAGVVSIHEGSIARCQELERVDRLNNLQTTTFSVNSCESNVSLERSVRIGEMGISESASVNIKRHLGDYQDVPLPDDSVIICDIPYKETEKYTSESKDLLKFDHERYYDWVRNHDRLIFTCEYWMPDDFVCVWKRERVSTLCATNNSLRKIEKLFVHRSKLDMYRPPQPMLFGFDEV